MTGPRVFLTGASGVVGSGLLRQPHGWHVTALAHTAAVGAADDVVHGDVKKPQFGLDDERYRRLVDETDVVIHSAAATTILRSADEILATNVDGTTAALELAERAGARMVLVSTMYVRGKHRETGDGRALAYQRSKQLAEEVVAGTGVPTLVVRPSVIVGDSTTGEITRFQGFYAAVRALVRGNAPLVPIGSGSFVDFLPRDVISSAIVALVAAGHTGNVWLTAGDRSLTMGDLVERCVAFAASIGAPVDKPRMVDAEMVDRLIMPAFGDDLPADVRKRLSLFTEIAAHLVVDEPMPSSLHDLAGVPGFPAMPDLHACLDASLGFWARETGAARG